MGGPTMSNQLRVPPHDVEIEQAVLGSMLINPKCIPLVAKIYSPGFFYRESHSLIAETIMKVGSDLLEIKTVLSNEQKLELVGGIDYIMDIAESTMTSGAIGHHIQILQELFRKRQIINISSLAMDMSFSGIEDSETILSQIKKQVRGIEADVTPDFEANENITKDILEEAENKSNQDKKDFCPTTGYIDIDTHMLGFEPGTTTYIIARPSIGKTALMLNIADNMVFNQKKNVAIFSLEMTAKRLQRRRLACQSDVYLSRIRAGDLDKRHLANLTRASNPISKTFPVILDNPKYREIESLVAMAESLAMEYRLDAIFVDHIQLMKSRQRFTSRHLEISHIAGQFCDFSKDLNLPVIILCQLNRLAEGRKNARPKLSDMKESGALEENADGVIAIYRENKESTHMEIGCLKGRDFGTFRTQLYFDRFIQKITDSKTEF